MRATLSTLAGSAPAPPAGPAIPTGPGQISRPGRLRRAASPGAIGFALAAILGLVSGGCGPDRSVAASGQERNQGDVSGNGALTIDDLPAALNLSTEQRTRLTAALSELRRDRNLIGHRLEAGARRRGHDGAGPRGRGNRGPGVRRHRDNGPDGDNGSERGYRPRRGNRPGGGARAEGGFGPGFEPPMIRFLETSSSILDGDQFVTLAKFLAGRRMEMHPGPGGPPAPFDGPLGRLAARKLGLTDAQQGQLKPLVMTFGESMRQVRDGIEAGTMTPEQARDRAKELRLNFEKGAQGVLAPEQWKQVQSIREGRRNRQSARLADAQPRHLDRITGMYVRVLELDEAKASQVRQIMEATIPARRAVAERRAQGTMEAEDFVYEVMSIDKNAAEQVRGVLTPDQAIRFDALLGLLPRGPHMGGLMGRPLGERAGGPKGPERGRRR